jgi:hypothetical protein
MYVIQFFVMLSLSLSLSQINTMFNYQYDNIEHVFSFMISDTYDGHFFYTHV